MKRQTGIRATLLRRLFLNPRPHNPAAYEEAIADLYPGIEHFKSFLLTDSEERREDLAKTIIGRICHNTRLAPPLSLILNIFAYEKRQSTQLSPPEGSYVPRDHFTHLVNLYLLGIYFFSYHTRIHSSCSRFLNRAKRRFLAQATKGTSGAFAPKNIYSLFAEPFSLFVLYHDTGYPLQDIPASERGEEVNRSYLVRYEEIPAEVLDELALKALSNLLVAKSILADPRRESLGEMYLNHTAFITIEPTPGSEAQFPDANLTAQRQPDSATETLIRSNWSGALFLPSVERHRLRALLAILPDDKVSAVLEETTTGRPIVMLLSKRIESQLMIGFSSASDRPAGFKRLNHQRLAASAFETFTSPRDNYVWHYFVQDAPSAFDDALQKLLPDTHTHIEKILGHLSKLSADSPESFLHSGSGRGSSFNIYAHLRKRLMPFEDSVDPEEVDDFDQPYRTIDTAVSSSISRLPQTVGAVLQSRMQDIVRQLGSELQNMIFTETLEAALNRFLAEIGEELPQLSTKLAHTLDPQIRSEVELATNIKVAFEEIRSAIEGRVDKVEIADEGGGVSDVPLNNDTKPEDLVGTEGPYAQMIEADLGSLGLPSLNDLVSKYRPSFRRDDPHFIDHGIGSTYSMIAAAKNYRRMMTAIKEDMDQLLSSGTSMIRLALLTDCAQSARGVEFEQKSLFEMAMLSTLLHNIYPANLSEQYAGYRTNLFENPFAFTCLLSDSLQEWDRRRVQNLALSKLAPSHYGDRFNIQIEGDAVHITIRGPRELVNDKSPRESLQEFLVGISDEIRITSIEE